ncbi:uncharacterized protein LOC116614879 isoform X2 [Nematostella vectensis]|uniref:uncharacterized protein LOC116614879 isoform X2 n=1 Tax=Nematostella vectensis TaxID=45351 RepID=UPI002076FC72|nr:uncharacterized protein LOC116614879 isoform X2 [Nematostella vectensis]
MAAPKRRRSSSSSSSSCSPSLTSPRYVTRAFLRERRASGIENIGPYFGRLPPEMIRLLISYLDAPGLSKFISTCRVFSSYTEQSWRKLCKKQGLALTPTVLCVANPANPGSDYDYDRAVELSFGEMRWKLALKRNWLYSNWKCVVCYRNCSQRVDSHFDVALCDTCHPLFYRRKCHAKEQFSLTEKDLRLLENDSYEFLVSDLIRIARAKYGNKEALEDRLQDRQRVKTRREAEKQCALIHREQEVIRALEHMNSSYEDIASVDARCMPYVSTPASYSYAPHQSPEDAAKWLIAWKDRQETRNKLLLAEISARASRCKGCRAKYDYRLVHGSKCTHVSDEQCEKLKKAIKENFHHDIAHYSRHGQLSLETGVYDLEHRSAQELFMRNERRMKLQEELESQREEWPEILLGSKDPMNCSYAQDYIYKGVAILDAEGNKCRLKNAKDVGRIILAQARGWNRRFNQVKEELGKKGFFPPFNKMMIESNLLIDDFVDSMIVVRGDHIVACTAVEIADRIAVIEGKEEEQKSAVAERCARIYAECNPRPDFEGLKQDRRNKLVKHMELESAKDFVKGDPCWNPAYEYVNCGTTTSLFGYKITTLEAVSGLIRLKMRLKARSSKIDKLA